MLLTKLGRTIFLDRYSKKDLTKRAIRTGSEVVVTVNPDIDKRDVATVVSIDSAGDSVLVDVEGERHTLQMDRVDVPLELAPEDAMDRMSDAIARAEGAFAPEYALAFRALLENFLFVPGGRVWAGAGVDEQLTPFNCYVIPAPHDSRGGIIETLRRMTEIFARGGGVGIPLMTLRPRRSIVRGVNGRSSGSVAWGEMYAHTTRLIEQGGSRRGALMLMQYDWHPDIYDFVTAKTDSERLNGCNMSVAVSDAFMEAVAKDAAWQLRFPDTAHPDYDKEWDGDLAAWTAKGRPVIVYQTIRARELWDLIIQTAWKSAEPGLFFVDRYNEYSNTNYYAKIYCCNPCQPSWATVLTPDGISTIGDIDVGSTVWSGKRWTKVVRKVATGTKPVYSFHTRAGTFNGTENHRVVQNGVKVEAKDAESIDLAYLDSTLLEPCSVDVRDVMDGLVLGDGTYHGASDKVVLLIGADDSSYHASEVAPLIGEHRPGIKPTAWEVQTRFTELPKTYERVIPSSILSAGSRVVRGFLRGLYSANGSVVGRRVTLKASSFAVVESVQTMLSSLGIPSYYTTNRAHDVEFENGTYLCRESYDLNIGTQDGRRQFQRLIGFIQPYKRDKLEEACAEGLSAHPAKNSFEIVSREYLGDEPVFDITVEAEEHTYWTGGLLVSNCGEQGLPPWGVCNLGHINLAQCLIGTGVNEPAVLDKEKLRRTVRTAVRFMDDVIDIAFMPFQENRDRQYTDRRIGLGTLGLAEALTRMHIPYGNNLKCLDTVDAIYRTIAVEAYLASADLAQEKGSFAGFDAEKLLSESRFMREMPEEVRTAIREKGLRNATLLTQAPTGSTGTMVGTSTGIEPYFKIEWARSGRLGTHVERAAPYAEWRKLYADAEKPSWFVTTDDLVPEDHAYVQAAIQRWTDSSISKTSNLPSDYTPEQVGEYYELLYRLGCKGGTVYVDGSRESQVLSAVPEVSTPTPVVPGPVLRPHPNGPYAALCDAVATPVGKLHAKLSVVDGLPFDVWLDVSKGGTDINADREAMARLISVFLRVDSPIPPVERLAMVIDQLEGIGGGNTIGFGKNRVSSLPDGVAKVLRSLLHSFTATSELPTPELPVSEHLELPPSAKSSRSVDICPSCHKATFVRSEGCQKCDDCGYSRC